MDFTIFTASTDDDSRRIDRLCLKMMPHLPRSAVFSALRKGLIKVDGKKVKPQTQIHAGSRIEIASFLTPLAQDSKGTGSEIEKLPFDIVFKNADIMFICKPSGISVQPSRDSDTSVSECIKKSAEKNDSLSFTPAPLHRIDRYTSGLLAVSQSTRGARIFKELMESHSIKKTYLGICEGRLPEESEWKDFISEEENLVEGSFYRVKVSGKKTDGAREALTRARPLSAKEDLSLVLYTIETGRKHQIRAQSAFHGFPLHGDTAYGGKPLSKFAGNEKFFLHAYSLEFPKENELGLPQKITCPLPQHFENFLKNNLLNWDREIIL